tara:strand:+ start:467 stop:667 length:201 start_codon:yes stop_codon:yes gene_type:complete
MIKKDGDNKVRICCGKNGCPTVEMIDENTFKVTDDDGNTIVVKKEELKLMGDAVATITEDRQLLNG